MRPLPGHGPDMTAGTIAATARDGHGHVVRAPADQNVNVTLRYAARGEPGEMLLSLCADVK